MRARRPHAGMSKAEVRLAVTGHRAFDDAAAEHIRSRVVLLLETLSAAVAALTARGLTAEVTQIGVSRTKTAGTLHLLTANNPVFLISAEAAEAAL